MIKHEKRGGKMKKIFIFTILIIASATTAVAMQRSVTVQWSYPSGVVGVAGFRFYRDGVLVGTVNNPAARTYTMNLDISTNKISLTMTTFFTDGKESVPSTVKTILTFSPLNLRAVPPP